MCSKVYIKKKHDTTTHLIYIHFQTFMLVIQISLMFAIRNWFASLNFTVALIPKSIKSVINHRSCFTQRLLNAACMSLHWSL